MSSSHLKKLLEFLQEEPDDPFTLYAIATEYRTKDVDKALYYYEKLLSEHPQYVATYYHAALLYADLEQPIPAERTFKKGIAVAEEQQEVLALRELQNAYNEFLFEE